MKKRFFISAVAILLYSLQFLWMPTRLLAREDIGLKIGWSSIDITPTKPVLIAGQFHARISEGVMDPLTATALAIESLDRTKGESVIIVSCDLIAIPDLSRNSFDLRAKLSALVKKLGVDINPQNILLSGTHTHAAPVVSGLSIEQLYGVSLATLDKHQKGIISPEVYGDYLVEKLSILVKDAWEKRKNGGISYGLGKAAIGNNRLQVVNDGKSIMYGDTNKEAFSHIEGYEDHDLNLLFTWDENRKLTGVLVNAAVTSQVSEHSYLISADFWHDARNAFKEKFGEDVFVLGQASAAGDQSPHLMYNAKANLRMHKLMGYEKFGLGRGSIGHRLWIAEQLVNGASAIYPYMKENIEWSPEMRFKVKQINLSRRLLGAADLTDGADEAALWKVEYEKSVKEPSVFTDNESNKKWLRDVTINYTKMRRGESVKERYDLEKTSPKLPIEVRALRLGDMVMVSNPFELYLDYGIQMKARSAAVQTFIVQLAGPGTYLPTERSIRGGAYGAVPASTLIGPEGGRELVNETLDIISTLY